jgi:phosphoribosylamine--glycine ligase
MLTGDGPLVLEYNCRFGNPETQALVRVLDEDLLDLLHRAATGDLEGVDAVHAHGAAAAVCVAAANYPELQLEPAPVLVTGLDAAREVEGVELFIGLAQSAPSGSSDELLAAGGRVVTVSAWGDDMEQAVERAYRAAELVQVPGRQLRRDIGRAAVRALVAAR